MAAAWCHGMPKAAHHSFIIYNICLVCIGADMSQEYNTLHSLDYMSVIDTLDILSFAHEVLHIE